MILKHGKGHEEYCLEEEVDQEKTRTCWKCNQKKPIKEFRTKKMVTKACNQCAAKSIKQ